MRVSATQGHRLWAPVYDSGHNPLLALESRIVRGLLEPVPTHVVDVGCGTGRWASYCARLGTNVYGADSCEEMLAQAARYDFLKGRLALAQAEHLPFREGIADLVLCSFVASYFSSLRCAVSEMARVCAPDACVLISDMHPAAVATGWSRSFRVNHSRYEIETAQYSKMELYEAATAAGLRLIAEFDARFGEPERSLFKRAGKDDFFDSLSTLPAVWISMWRKT